MNEFTLRAILAGATPDAVEAIDRAVREGTILNHPDVAPVVDADGDPLIKNQVYRKSNGQLFRVTDWKFGSGNIMDTYYWVWGIDSNLKDDRITVGAKHQSRSRIYPSKLTKTFAIELLPEEIRVIILSRRLDAVKRGDRND